MIQSILTTTDLGTPMKQSTLSKLGGLDLIWVTQLSTSAGPEERFRLLKTLKNLAGISTGRLKVYPEERRKMTTVLRKAIEMGYNYSRLARVTGINRWTVMEWVKDKSRQSTSSQCSTIVIERRDEAEERNEALQGQNSELVQASIS